MTLRRGCNRTGKRAGSIRNTKTRGNSKEPRSAQRLTLCDRAKGFTSGLLSGHYNFRTMLRRFIAVLILHFLLCVGFSADGLNPPISVPQGPEVVARGASSSPGTPLAFSDADDHALMDDKGDLPDQLEPRRRTSSGNINTIDVVSTGVARVLSAVVDPPHRPPRLAGSFA